MGLILLDGFEGYGPDGTLAASDTTFDRRLGMRWDRVLANYGGTSSCGRISGSSLARGGKLCFNLYNSNSKYWRTWIGDRSQIILGFAIRPYQGEAGEYVYFRHGGTASGQYSCLRFVITTNGYIQLKDASNTLIDTSTKALIRFNRWNYIEIKATFHNSTGSVELRHNGKTVITANNQDLAYLSTHNHIDTLEFKFWDELLYDDIYVIDPTTSGLNDFLGPAVVRRLSPSADTVYSDFTCSSGTDTYQCVDDARADQSDYIYSSSVDDDEIWNYEDVPSEIAAVKGINIETSAYVTGSQPKTVASLFMSSTATISEIDDEATVSSDWESFNHILENDPSTSSPWTVAGLNAGFFGVRHKA